MADLKTPWTAPPVGDVGLTGDLVTERGGDPNVDPSGVSGLRSPYDNPPAGSMPDKETANSVSGLPTTPARWTPTDTPPPPPDLTDRNPGTIDQK